MFQFFIAYVKGFRMHYLIEFSSPVCKAGIFFFFLHLPLKKTISELPTISLSDRAGSQMHIMAFNFKVGVQVLNHCIQEKMVLQVWNPFFLKEERDKTQQA